MVAVEAKPTMGAISGKQARMRPSMKPALRGRTPNSSITFDMVGVSYCARSWRSEAERVIRAYCKPARRVGRTSGKLGTADRGPGARYTRGEVGRCEPGFESS